MFYIKKKIRGQRRKINDLKKRMDDYGSFFPDDSYVHDKYYHNHFPCYQGLLDSKNSSSKLRRTSMQMLIDSAIRLRENRPDKHLDKKIVISITLPYIWDSQVTVFYDKEYFDTFFDRNSREQTWTEIKESKTILDTHNLNCPTDFKVKGYIEEIIDEDYSCKSEIWFIGEL